MVGSALRNLANCVAFQKSSGMVLDLAGGDPLLAAELLHLSSLPGILLTEVASL